MRVMSNKSFFESLQESLKEEVNNAPKDETLIFDSEDEIYRDDSPEAEADFDADYEDVCSLIDDQVNEYIILNGYNKTWDRGGDGYKVKESLSDLIGNYDGIRVYKNNDGGIDLYLYDHDGYTSGTLYTFKKDSDDEIEKVLQEYFEDDDISLYYFLDWVDAGVLKILQERGLLVPLAANGVINESEELEPKFANRKSFYGKAHVDTLEDGTKVLTSYETKVASVKDGKVSILCDKEDLTQTTLRHIDEFLKQCGVQSLPKKELVKLINKEESSEVDDKEVLLGTDETIEECGENCSKQGDKIEEQDSTIRIYKTNDSEREYSIVDITDLNEISDGDVQPPIDVAGLLTEVDSRLTESFGNWGTINLQSTRFNKDTNDSNALFELNVGKDTYLMSMLLEENCSVLKVNNTNGRTIFKRKSNDVVGLAESYIKQFISGKEADEIPECIKHISEPLHERLAFIKSYIDMVKLAPKEEKDAFNAYIQKEIYAFIAEVSDEVKATEPNDEDKLELPTFDKMVEEVFGKEWVKEQPKENKLELEGTETLTEDAKPENRYRILRELEKQFEKLDDIDYGDIEGSERYGDMKPGIAEQNEINEKIKQLVQDNNITKEEFDQVAENFGGLDLSISYYEYVPKHAKVEESDEPIEAVGYAVRYLVQVGPGEYKSEDGGTYTNEEQAEERVAELRAQGFDANYDIIWSREEDPNYDKDVDETDYNAEHEAEATERMERRYGSINEADEVESTEEPEEVPADKVEAPKVGLGTGYASFVRKPSNIEDLDNKAKYFTDGDASYLICKQEELSKDEFDKIQDNFLSDNEYCKSFEPLDTDNYSYNVIELTCKDYDYKLLVDPSGFSYCRYVAKI